MPETSPESPAPAADRDLSGRALGDYRLLRRLGRGAMAEVYLAEQVSLRRKVAVKILRSELSGDATYIRRFRHEAQAAAGLICAQIVQIHEVGCVDGIHYIAQEYVEGLNLREWLARHGPLAAGEAIAIMRQVALALHKAASQGIVHRDIKPENIMLSRQGEVKVADFGLARVVGNGQALNLTQVGVTMGTPLYMSPEQVEGKPLDQRSDIYSFGVTCYHVLAGHPPFEGETALGVALQHLQQQPAPLAAIRPDLPAALCQIVHRALAKAPDDRFCDPGQLLRALRELDGGDDQWAEGLDFSLPPADAGDVQLRTRALAALTQVMAAERAGRPPWARRLLAMTAMAVLVLAVAALLGAWGALALREPYLLSGADPHRTAIPKQKNVLAQWFLATRDGSEEAWLSVIQHFPDEQYYVLRAKQRLAMLYLRKDRPQDALRIFDELAALGDDALEFRAFGLAGQCVVLGMAGQHAQSQRVVHELAIHREHLRDRELRVLVARILPLNRRALDQQEADEFEQWLLDKFPSEES